MPLHCGDLNDAQWQKLHPLLLIKACTGQPATDHERLSMAFCGFTARAHPGTICPPVMDHLLYRAASIVDASKASGRKY